MKLNEIDISAFLGHTGNINSLNTFWLVVVILYYIKGYFTKFVSDAGKNKDNLNLLYTRNNSWVDIIEYLRKSKERV